MCPRGESMGAKNPTNFRTSYMKAPGGGGRGGQLAQRGAGMRINWQIWKADRKIKRLSDQATAKWPHPGDSCWFLLLNFIYFGFLAEFKVNKMDSGSTKVPLFFQGNQGAQNWKDERAKSEATARKGDGARGLLTTRRRAKRKRAM